MRVLASVLATLLAFLLVLPAAAKGALEIEPTAVPVLDADDPEAREEPGGVGSRIDAADLEAWLDGLIPYVLEQTDVAGSVVIVVQSGEVLLQKGYGYADVAERSPVDPERTLFRPGSVSKLFTWTAVMQLVEQGKLDLDADINGYLDYAVTGRDGAALTLRHIMTHTTGMEEQIRWLIATDPDAVAPLDEALKHWVPKRIFAPGEISAYSNYATALAGYIVQRVSGEPFDAYIKRHIFEPLGMQHSSFSQPLEPELLAQMSKGYSTASDGEAKDYEFINLAPAGSLAATASDMGRFMIAHLQNGAYGSARILREGTAIEMHTTGRDSIRPLNRMMLGFYETTMNGHRAIAHGGDTLWFHSDLQLFLDDGIGIFVSTNSAGKNGSARNVRDALVTGFVNRYLPAAEEPPTPALDEATARQHAAAIAGQYLSSRRTQSSFMSILNLLSAVQVIPNDDGTISVPMLSKYSGAPRKWQEVQPWVWRDVDGSALLAAEVEDGRVLRFSAEPLAAIMVFERQPAWASPSLLATLFFGSLGILLLTVLAWPISALIRRRYGVSYPLTGGDARAHRVVRIAALLVVAATGGLPGLVIAMMSNLNLMTPAMDSTIVGLRIFALVALPLGVLVGLWNARSVLRSQRSRWAKLWALLLLLAFLVVLCIGWRYHLMGVSAFY